MERAEEYAKTNVELLKLNSIDKSADVVSSLVSQVVIIFTIALSILIVNIGFALWIGKVLHETFYGFFVIGAFYALLSLLLYLFRNMWIKYPVNNAIIQHMLKERDNEK
jgi:hypothetical protein